MATGMATARPLRWLGGGGLTNERGGRRQTVSAGAAGHNNQPEDGARGVMAAGMAVAFVDGLAAPPSRMSAAGVDRRARLARPDTTTNLRTGRVA